MQKRVHHTGADFRGEFWDFFGCVFLFFFLLLLFVLVVVFYCLRSTSCVAASPSELWVSCNDPKVTGQCNMGI